MKRFASLILAVVMVVAMATGCGGRSETEWTTPEDSYEDEYSDDNLYDDGGKSDEPATEPASTYYNDVAEYPGELAHSITWTEEIKGGFQLKKRVVVWDPAPSDQAYEHPADPELIIEINKGRDGDIAWIMPFVASVMNVTDGFDLPAKVDICVSDSKGVIGRSEDETTVACKGNTLPVSYEDYMRNKTDEAYLLVVVFNGLEEVSDKLLSWSGELYEGEAKNLVGYLLFVDAKRTPKEPNGVGADWFYDKNTISGYAGTGQVAFVVGQMWASMYACEKVVGLTKNGQGDLVICKTYDIESR